MQRKRGKGEKERGERRGGRTGGNRTAEGTTEVIGKGVTSEGEGRDR